MTWLADHWLWIYAFIAAADFLDSLTRRIGFLAAVLWAPLWPLTFTAALIRKATR